MLKTTFISKLAGLKAYYLDARGLNRLQQDLQPQTDASSVLVDKTTNLDLQRVVDQQYLELGKGVQDAQTSVDGITTLDIGKTLLVESQVIDALYLATLLQKSIVADSVLETDTEYLLNLAKLVSTDTQLATDSQLLQVDKTAQDAQTLTDAVNNIDVSKVLLTESQVIDAVYLVTDLQKSIVADSILETDTQYAADIQKFLDLDVVTLLDLASIITVFNTALADVIATTDVYANSYTKPLATDTYSATDVGGFIAVDTNAYANGYFLTDYFGTAKTF